MLLLPPSEEMMKKMESDVYQHPDKTAKDIKQLKAWIEKQPHLPQDMDDVMLEMFLYSSKYSLERCKKLLDNHYTLRTCLPLYFSNLDPTSQEIKDMNKVCYRVVFPNCTPEGYRVTMLGFLDGDVSKYEVDVATRRDVLAFITLAKIDRSYGVVLIYDTRKITMSHAAKFILHIPNIGATSNDCMPFRVKQLHFIYASSTMKKILQLLSPLLKPKIRERIHVHTDDLSTLYKFIPQEIFPSDFGGNGGSIVEMNDAWQKQNENIKQWLMRELSKKTDETKRPKDSQRNELFGVDGSFKYLNID